nr:DNA (cytosine-5-)-methyltransferase [Mycoplasma miroungigenitalium]
MKKIRAASFFAGVGGIDLGFNKYCEIVYANEFDKNAGITYKENFQTEVDIRDIRTVNNKEIPDFDVMLAGFPCQAFSIAGYRHGFNDLKGRGNLFFELERIFKEKNQRLYF